MNLSLPIESGNRARFLYVGKAVAGRSIKDIAFAVEARSMARTIPRMLGGVPFDDATEVRADGRLFMQGPRVVTVDRHLGQAASKNRSGAGSDVLGRVHLVASQPLGILRGDIKLFLGEFG